MRKLYVLFIALVLSGCAVSSPKESVVSLDGSWIVGGEQSPSLSFENGKVYGSTGCNRILGTYEVDGNSLKFSRLATTMMACQIDERVVLNGLNSVDSFEIVGDALVLKNGDEEIIRFWREK